MKVEEISIVKYPNTFPETVFPVLFIETLLYPDCLFPIVFDILNLFQVIPASYVAPKYWLYPEINQFVELDVNILLRTFPVKSFIVFTPPLISLYTHDVPLFDEYIILCGR